MEKEKIAWSWTTCQVETTEHFNDYKAATKKPTCTANLDGKEVEGSSWMADYARSHRAG